MTMEVLQFPLGRKHCKCHSGNSLKKSEVGSGKCFLKRYFRLQNSSKYTFNTACFSRFWKHASKYLQKKVFCALLTRVGLQKQKLFLDFVAINTISFIYHYFLCFSCRMFQPYCNFERYNAGNTTYAADISPNSDKPSINVV